MTRSIQVFRLKNAEHNQESSQVFCPNSEQNHATSSAQENIAGTAQKPLENSEDADELLFKISQLSKEIERLNETAHAMQQSKSWKLTKPLRFTMSNIVRPSYLLASKVLSREWLSYMSRKNLAHLLLKKLRHELSLASAKRFEPAVLTKLTIAKKFEPAVLAKVTIVVVQSGDEKILNECLAALSINTTGVSFRVIVVGSASHEIQQKYGIDIIDNVLATKSLAVLRNSLHEIDSELIVLISDQLIAHVGWLEAIDQVFDRFKNAGAACALILDNNGDVVSAGSNIASNMQLKPNFAGMASDNSVINTVKPVTAAGRGFLAIRNITWKKIAPNFSDDTIFETGLVSIAIELANIGESTYSQPFARFTISTTQKLKTTREKPTWEDAYKHWALRNRFGAKFLIGTKDTDILAVPKRPKVMIIDAFVPKPDQDSGSIDAFWYTRIFDQFGYEVIFIAALEAEQIENKHYADDLRQWGIQVRYAQNLSLLNEFLMKELFDIQLLIINRVMIASPLVPNIRQQAPHVKIIFNTVDLHYLREERAALLKHSAEALYRAFLTQQEELKMIQLSHAAIVVSHFEQSIIQRILPKVNVHYIPIPRIPLRFNQGFSERSGVVFIGNFSHAPNIDAVKFLVDDIWPIVHQRLPTAILSIVGSNITSEIIALDNTIKGIKVVGFVENLEPIFKYARLSVAPLRFGAGVKGKVISSLLHGLPCVLSKIASEGMELVDGEHILEGETAEMIAEAIIRLYEDPLLWQHLADAGFAIAAAKHSLPNVAAKITHLLESIDITKPSHILHSMQI